MIFHRSCSFILTKRSTQYKGSLNEEFVDNVVYPCSEKLFTNKNNEILIYATAWVNLENTMLSKQKRRDTRILYDTKLPEISTIGKSGRTECKLMFSGD